MTHISQRGKPTNREATGVHIYIYHCLARALERVIPQGSNKSYRFNHTYALKASVASASAVINIGSEHLMELTLISV